MVGSSFQGSARYNGKSSYKMWWERFPNLFVLLKKPCTFSITSAECQRSFSTMRRLRTWLGASMKMERLGSVAIMNIHRQEKVDYKHVSELFFQLHPRKVNWTNLLFYWISWNLKKWTFWFIDFLKIRHYNFINPFMTEADIIYRNQTLGGSFRHNNQALMW